jgi:hypothetical protein
MSQEKSKQRSAGASIEVINLSRVITSIRSGDELNGRAHMANAASATGKSMA